MKHIFYLLPFLLFIIIPETTLAQFSCGISEQDVPASTIRLMGQANQLLVNQKARKATTPPKICRIAVDIDSDTYLAFEKDTNRIRRSVLSQIESVSQIFERDINTQLVVVYIHIWKDTDPDPYKGQSNIFELLHTLSSTWKKSFKATPYDKAMYLYTKSVNGARGVAEGLPGIYSTSPLNGLDTIAHELGHCFGSAHTHNCAWPGGPIDFCAQIEGGNCYDNGSLEISSGSIMSYCKSIPYRFHPFCQAVMVDHASNNLVTLATGPDKPPLLPAQTRLFGSRFLYWDGQPLAEGYTIQVSNSADFSQPQLSDTTAINGYDLSRILLKEPVFVRVRAKNRFGASDWSAVCQVSLAEDALATPALLSPGYDQRSIPYNNGQLTFSVVPVAGATSYEVQVGNPYDSEFRYSAKFTSSQASATFSINQTGAVIWRARAIAGNRTSPWSSIGRFFVSAAPYRVSLAFKGNPLSFPYVYQPCNEGVSIQASLATDLSFTKAVYQKSFNPNPMDVGIIGMLENLQPNTQYYLKIEEISNGQRPDFPQGVLSQYVHPFKTGATKLPAEWSFVNSAVYPDLPQGNVWSMIATTNAIWLGYYNSGLFRINPDSTASRPNVFNRASTNGKIGGLTLLISSSATDELWVSNSVSSYGGASFIAGRQIGKLSPSSEELAERVVLKPRNIEINSFSVKPLLFHGVNAVYVPKDDSLTKLYESPANRYIARRVAGAGVVWLYQYNNDISGYELVELNVTTKATRTFSFENTPQLGKYIIDIALDAFNNLWVAQSNNTYPFPSLAKFDGQKWTAYSYPAVPVASVTYLTNDNLGNLYVLDNQSTKKIHRYDGRRWTTIGEIPSGDDLGEMKVDNRGRIWFKGNFQVIGYNRCANVATPKLSASKQRIQAGESATLRAEGCISTVWSWSNATESVSDRLVENSNTLVINPVENTSYRVRCYDDGCSGTDAKLALAILPTISVADTKRLTYCPGDVLTVSVKVKGAIDNTSPYTLVLKTDSQVLRYPASYAQSELSATLSKTLSPGRYTVYAENSPLGIRSVDSLQIRIMPYPTAQLSSSKVGLMPVDSAQISVALTGTPPWRFLRWDKQQVQTDVSPYMALFKTNQYAASYPIAITTLSDANCATGTVNNALTLSSIVLANEPSSLDEVAVYPNPTTGKLEIKADQMLKFVSATLSDLKGQLINTKSLLHPVHRFEWDISLAAPGAYLLHLKTEDNKVLTRKIIKLP